MFKKTKTACKTFCPIFDIILFFQGKMTRHDQNCTFQAIKASAITPVKNRIFTENFNHPAAPHQFQSIGEQHSFGIDQKEKLIQPSESPSTSLSDNKHIKKPAEPALVVMDFYPRGMMGLFCLPLRGLNDMLHHSFLIFDSNDILACW